MSISSIYSYDCWIWHINQTWSLSLELEVKNRIEINLLLKAHLYKLARRALRKDIYRAMQSFLLCHQPISLTSQAFISRRIMHVILYNIV